MNAAETVAERIEADRALFAAAYAQGHADGLAEGLAQGAAHPAVVESVARIFHGWDGAEAAHARLPRTAAEFRPGAEDALAVLHADAMTLSEQALAEVRPAAAAGGPTALVANLPYNVAVPVLLHALAVLPGLRHGLVMVQEEVADRLAAGPGSRVYGVPSAKAAWYADVRKAGTIGTQVFWPAPRIHSGLVAFTRREPPAGSASRREVFAVVDAAFAQRRKTLRAALASWAGSPQAAEDALVAAGVDPRARGEALDIAAFARIAEHGPRRPEEEVSA